MIIQYLTFLQYDAFGPNRNHEQPVSVRISRSRDHINLSHRRTLSTASFETLVVLWGRNSMRIQHRLDIKIPKVDPDAPLYSSGGCVIPPHSRREFEVGCRGKNIRSHGLNKHKSIQHAKSKS